MALDMKEIIAEATKTLLLDKKVKKLTVKDIVEECNITRQSFYYHFEDIPHLLQWIMERGFNQMKKEVPVPDDPEEGLRYLFLLAIHIKPYLKKVMQTNYREEISSLFKKQIYKIFENVVEEKNLYRQFSRSELDLVLRFYSYAVLGLIQNWTEEDTKNIDEIVHMVYLFGQGKIFPC